MSTLSRTEFLNKMSGSRVDLKKVDGVTTSEKAAIRKADLNGDGKVAGSAEMQRLFRNMDNFDRNGSASSVETSRPAMARMTTAIAEAAGKPSRALRGSGASAATGPSAAAPTGSNAQKLAKAKARAIALGLTITSTTGGRHAPRSYHYQGRAIDVSGSPAKMAQFYREMAGARPTELFYDPLGGMKNGRQIGAIGGHGNHVHVAF
jgi:hypothetical protein